MRRLCRIIGGAMPLGLGDAEVADEVYHGMMALSPEQVIGKSEEEVEAAMKAREGTAKVRIVQAWKFLRDQGLVKCLQPATLGKNAGYLLLLGGDEENRAVERWARQCLGLPMVW